MFLSIVDGEWGCWGDWSNCSKACDGGESMRSRLCDDPPPQYGGSNCSGNELLEQQLLSNNIIQQHETKTCNQHHCPGM